MGRPGIILYLDMLDPLKSMSLDDVGRLTLAMLEYEKSGKLPEFNGILAIVWGFVKPKMDRDAEEYERTILKRKYASFCRECKKKGEQDMSFDDWMKTFCVGDNQNTSMIPHDITCNHMIPHDINYNYNPNPNSNHNDNYSCSCNDNDNADSDDEDGGNGTDTYDENKLTPIGGKLGNGVVFISDKQMSDLLDKMGIELFNYYVDKLANFIIQKDARVKNHYETILKWWREDGQIEGGSG